MRKSLEQFEMLDKYINGTLSSAEKDLIETQLKTDSGLRDQLQFQKQMITAVRRKALRAEIAQAGKPGSFGKGWLATIVIAIVASAALAGYLMIGQDDKTTDEIAKTPLETTRNFSADTKHTRQTIHQLTDRQNITSIPVDSLDEPDKLISSTRSGKEPIPVAMTKFDPFAGRQTTTLQPWLPFEKQLFTFKNENGATIEGKDGTLIIVPKNGFVDENNDPVTGNISLELIEAISMFDILRYNLKTVSGKDALSSGGMLHIAAVSGGKEVKVNPEKPLYVEIPTQDYNSQMMAWKGEEKNGEVDWIDPQPLKKYLVKVDFSNLDLLPEGFDDEVERNLPFRNHKTASKKLVDSLYYALGKGNAEYAFAGGKGGLKVVDIEGNGVEGLRVSFYMNNKIAYTLNTNADGIASPVNSGVYSITIQDFGGLLSSTTEFKIPSGGLASYQVDYLGEGKEACYIDPASVKAIQNKEFTNTFLATKEFEQRIRLLHKMKKGNALFNLYVNNLTKDLWEVDKMVADQLIGSDKNTFADLSAEKLTNVENAPLYQAQLSAFYNRKREELKREEEEKYKDYWKNTDERIAELREEMQDLKNMQLLRDNWTLKSKAVPAGSKYPAQKASSATGNSYSTPWYSTGWMNIDCYLHSIEKDPGIVSIVANQDGDYKIYQCLNTLKTLIGLNEMKTGIFEAHYPSEKTPESKEMTDTYCMGIKRSGSSFMFAYAAFNPYKIKDLKFDWKSVSDAELFNHLKSISGANDMLISDLEKEQERLESIAASRAALAKLEEDLKVVGATKSREAQMMQKLEDFIDQCISQPVNGQMKNNPVKSNPVKNNQERLNQGGDLPSTPPNPVLKFEVL